MLWRPRRFRRNRAWFFLWAPEILIATGCFLPSVTAIASQPPLRVLHSFPEVGSFINPVVFDPSENLFGTSGNGGEADVGTIFELAQSSDGSRALKILHSFDPATEGQNPVGGLAIDTAGSLFGVTSDASISAGGSVFELLRHSDGEYDFQVLHRFSSLNSLNQNTDGYAPLGGLAIGSDGTVYGATSEGGANGFGTVFSVGPIADGHPFTVIYSFTADGSSPNSLSIDEDGNLFGAQKQAQGANGGIFELERGTGGFTFHIVHLFTAYDGQFPLDRLEVDDAGNVFGVTGAGSYQEGGVFELARGSSGDYQFKLIHSLSSDGLTAVTSLARDSAGDLVGFATSGTLDKGVLAYELVHDSPDNWTFEVLKRLADNSFTAGDPVFNGTGGIVFFADFTPDPYATGVWGHLFELEPGGDGSLLSLLAAPYGTEGNTAGTPNLDLQGNLFMSMKIGGVQGFGTVLELQGTNNGYVPVVLHTFVGPPSDGALASGGFARDSSGDLYGTTERGGAADAGIIFKLAKGPLGYTYSTVYSFTGGSDGSGPIGVVADSNGHLFGMTLSGTVYRLSLSPNGSTLTVLHSFYNLQSAAPLVRDANGNLFGIWVATIFRISNLGSFSTLKVFDGPGETAPAGGLTLDETGTLFGVTTNTVFRISTSGTGFEVLHAFTNLDGYYPSAPLVIDSTGSLAGAAASGGFPGAAFGTVFRVSKDGSNFSLLHSFGGPFDGAAPASGLALDANGDLVGTTSLLGEFQGGAAFLIPQTGPSLSFTPISLPGGSEGTPYGPIPFVGSGGTPPYSFGQSGTSNLVGLPQGLTLTRSGILSGSLYPAGEASFTISMQDAEGYVFGLPLTIDIGPASTAPPVAYALRVASRGGTPVAIQLKGFDPSYSGAMVFGIDVPPAHGVLTNFDGSLGTVTYVPNTGYVGPDQFTYVTRVGNSFSPQATVSISISGQIDLAPIVPPALRPVRGRGIEAPPPR